MKCVSIRSTPKGITLFGFDIAVVLLLSLFMTDVVRDLKKISPSPTPPAQTVQNDLTVKRSEPSKPPEQKTLEVKVFGKPVTLDIPSIGMHTNIEITGNDDNGLQEVPNEASTVSLYQYGALPGNTGSAVLAGHYTLNDGTRGPFYDLNKTKIGDKIRVSDPEGLIKEYTVYKTETVKAEDFSVDNVYGSSDRPALNIVTCQGRYIPSKKDFSERLIVYSFLTQ